jgi:zinc D-Ala-D-Ala carboxypeptidase
MTTPRKIAATLLATAAAALTVAVSPVAAEAAIPASAQRWATLMHTSLTPSPAYLKLSATLTAQRKAVQTLAGRVTAGRATQSRAQAVAAAAVEADATARTRYVPLAANLIIARNRLTVVSQQRPADGAAVARAQQAVSAAITAAATPRTEAQEAAAALTTAQKSALAATTAYDKALAAWRTTRVSVQANEKKLNELDRSDEYAAQAVATGRSVVADVRPRFTVADTTAVYGITVHKSVAFAFRRMLDAAKADGIVLSGGGFRTKERQIQLRKLNGCPDVWTAPASSCRVPTAIPGRSLHEIGLAVDISSGGRTISSSSAAFKWLRAHAREYGFVNLPSEAWHWSITGG